MNLREEITLFEKRLNCRVAFHDLTGEITALAAPEELPLHHLAPCCETMRSRSAECYERCVLCDTRLIQPRLAAGRPFGKLCHAGVFEAVFPLMKFDAPAGVMFLGPFRPPETGWSGGVQPRGMETVSPPEAELPPDLFWFGSLFADSIRRRLEFLPGIGPRGGRGEQIRWWMERYFRSPGVSLENLAAELGLSVSRTSQLLRREFGRTFPELLNRYRLDCAAGILERSLLTVDEVAKMAGYRSANYLHRQFLKRFRMTPEEWRRRSGKDRVRF